MLLSTARECAATDAPQLFLLSVGENTRSYPSSLTSESLVAAHARNWALAGLGENIAIGEEELWPGQVVARWHDEIRNTQGGRCDLLEESLV